MGYFALHYGHVNFVRSSPSSVGYLPFTMGVSTLFIQDFVPLHAGDLLSDSEHNIVSISHCSGMRYLAVMATLFATHSLQYICVVHVDTKTSHQTSI